MVRKFLPKSGNSLGCDRPARIPPRLANVSENVGDLRIVQCLVPRLHHGCAILNAFHRDRTLQTF